MVLFPGALDSLTDPVAGDQLNSVTVPHATQHANLNDIAVALEAKVGANGSAVTTTHDFKLSGVTGSDKAASTANFTGTSSGTNTGDQTITITGGVTGSGTGSFAATVVTNANLTGPVTSTGNATAIANGAISNAMLANAAVANLSGTNTGDQTNISGNAATVTTNANLTGPITSVGNATSIASQTGTGTKFVVDTSPTLVTPNVGVATATSVNKVAITAPATSSTLTIDNGFTLHASGNATVSGVNTGDQTITLTGGVTGSGTGSFAATVVTNANLTGVVTSVGNATSIANGAITNAMLANAAVANLSGTNTGDQTSVSGNAGTATALQTARAIYGNIFDGTAALTQIIASTYGGTGNGFAKLSGPASSEKTFTLPNASATILTDNTAVTVAQGGTGAATLTGILKGNGTSAFTAVTAPGGAIVGDTDTQTLSNKRVTKRVSTTTSSATPTPNANTDDVYELTGLAVGATFGAPTGTPTDGQPLLIRIKDNGTSQSTAFNAIYRFSSDLAAQSATTINKTMYYGFFYNSADTKWDNVAQINNL